MVIKEIKGNTMNINVLIVHYNTPRLLDACIRSVKKTTPNAKIFVFENSDKKPFKNVYSDVTIFDNSKGQIIDFDKFLEQYPNRGVTNNNWASAKHAVSIDKCFDLIPDGFILLDSDVLVKKDLFPLWDEERYWVAEKAADEWGRLTKRVVPICCYLNVKKLRERGICYFDDRNFCGLHGNAVGDFYDTGTSLALDTEGLPCREIKLTDYVEHWRMGS